MIVQDQQPRNRSRNTTFTRWDEARKAQEMAHSRTRTGAAGFLPEHSEPPAPSSCNKILPSSEKISTSASTAHGLGGFAITIPRLYEAPCDGMAVSKEHKTERKPDKQLFSPALRHRCKRTVVQVLTQRKLLLFSTCQMTA